MEKSRRDFLKVSASVAVSSAALGGAAWLGKPIPAGAASSFTTPASTRKEEMLYRKLGATGEEVSLIGLGGFHIGQPKEERVAIEIIRKAIDHGVTFMDNSWDYKPSLKSNGL